MSSRILRNEQVEIQQVHWEPLKGSELAAAETWPGAGARGEAEPTPPEADALHSRVRELEQHAEQSTREAFQRGVQQGEAEGHRKAQAQIEAEIERLARTVMEMAGLRRAIRREAEEELVRLALAIARRVLHRELTVDSEAMAGLVKAALSRIEMREIYRVRTHPEHAPTVTRCLAQIGAPPKIEVVADAALEKGSAIFETARGTMDASVETQLAEIQRGLVDLLE